MTRNVFSWMILSPVVMGMVSAALLSDGLEPTPEKAAAEPVVVETPNLWIGGIIPYEIASVFSSHEVNIIKGAMREIQRKSCIHFRDTETGDQSSIIFNSTYNAGCFAFWGRQLPNQMENINRQLDLNHKKQLVNLESECLNHGHVIHVLMHTLGFLHEETRSDRDQYVQIKWENIGQNNKDQFRIQSGVDTLGLAYDFDSVMHRPRNAYSRNGKDTIVPKQPYEGRTFGNKQTLSATDAKKIIKLYKCPNSVAA